MLQEKSYGVVADCTLNKLQIRREAAIDSITRRTQIIQLLDNCTTLHTYLKPT